MSRAIPPAPEDVVQITPEQLLAAIAALQTAEFSQELAPYVRIVIAASKTLLDLYRLLSTFRITIQKIRKFLGVPTPKKGDGNGKGDGADVAPPSDNPDDKDKGAAPQGGEDGDGDEEDEDDKNNEDNKPSDARGARDGPDPANTSEDEDKKKRDQHGRLGKNDFPNANQRYFAHPDFGGPGCECPECLAHRVYLMGAVGGGIRFTGQSSIAVTGINYEIWRCGECGAHFPAAQPADIKNDGGSRFGFTAAANIAISKYLAGTPWSRQENLGHMLDLKIPASTQCQQSLQVAEAALPVYEHLFPAAAPARLFYTDDTGCRIIGLTEENKTQRTTGKTVTRTGVHTSCVLAKLENGQEIVIYKSGIIHAGELLDEVLINRPKHLPRPHHMSDGHSANPPTVCPVTTGDCNAHARRKVEEKQTQWQRVWTYVDTVYKAVYKADRQAKTQKLTDDERLALHRRESLPRMKEMFQWMQARLDDKSVDPNSGLGGVFEYFLIRERSLLAFCYYPGFPIDNNLCESAQKLVAQHRKNAEYFRTLRGAYAGDIIMSLGATMKKTGGNILDYLVNLQRYRAEVAKRPQDFLPWTYLATVKLLEAAAPPPVRVLEVSGAEFHDRQRRLRSKRAWGRAARPKNQPAVATAEAR